MEVGKGRKVRSDKKREIQPTISKELRECIFRLSYITDTPVKDVAEAVCVSGIGRKKVISYLSQNFRRDVRVDNTLYMGDMDRAPVKKRTAAGRSERISIRFRGQTYESIHTLAYALDCTTSRACALLLDASIRDVDFVNDFVEEYLKKYIDEHRMGELKKVLKYVNANNPYDETISWARLLSYMVEEVKVHAEKVQDTVSDFIVNNWKR
ncbi:hypothetical protein [Sporosarcina sp. E16_8]|uniref:hypothetical protein n=1 Tax=Sporosarcina sp. E16_8 TaxID=2789295 RepID=UPI001A9174FD|nr:hypothetical protein [Sporosarcina sp. E16_8]MBO0586098.1 hypothetical protein [Sporosarcina sp. E16_8]